MFASHFGYCILCFERDYSWRSRERERERKEERGKKRERVRKKLDWCNQMAEVVTIGKQERVNCALVAFCLLVVMAM